MVHVSMRWLCTPGEDFENTLYTVWTTAFTEKQLQLQFGLVGGLADSQRTRTPARRALPATVPKNDGLSNSGDKMEDITIVLVLYSRELQLLLRLPEWVHILGASTGEACEGRP